MAKYMTRSEAATAKDKAAQLMRIEAEEEEEAEDDDDSLDSSDEEDD